MLSLVASAFLAWPIAPAVALHEREASAPALPTAEALDVIAGTVAGHVTVLTSPFFEGRSPGTAGSARAKDYAEFFLGEAGLEPAFDGRFRQDFDIAGPTRVLRQELVVGGDAFVGAREFTALGLGGPGAAEGELVFVGYAIQDGPDGYTSFPGTVDLTGCIALVLRFEPRNERGRSRWSEDGQWTQRAAIDAKVRACLARGAAAVVIANPPGAGDPRARRLMDVSEGGRGTFDLPVLHVTSEAAQRIFTIAGLDAVGVAAQADERGEVKPLGVRASIDVGLERTRIPAQNLGGLVRGAGELADQIVVVGAHIDHVGDGRFGAPGDGRPLHPGADDNASGTSAVLELARRFGEHARTLGEELPRRTVLVLFFDAEESGLLGSQHYCANPIAPIERHVLMLNLDMVGRIQEGRVNVQGQNTAEGLAEWLAPTLALAPDLGLDARLGRGVSARSDHASFLAAGVPAMFFTNGDGHPDYHRPSDTADKLEARSLAGLVALVEQITHAAIVRPEPFVHVPTQVGGRAR